MGRPAWTTAQMATLLALRHGPIMRDHTGYRVGGIVVRQATIGCLERRGVVLYQRLGRRKGTACLTPAGRAVLAELGVDVAAPGGAA